MGDQAGSAGRETELSHFIPCLPIIKDETFISPLPSCITMDGAKHYITARPSVEANYAYPTFGEVPRDEEEFTVKNMEKETGGHERVSR